MLLPLARPVNHESKSKLHLHRIIVTLAIGFVQALSVIEPHLNGCRLRERDGQVCIGLTRLALLSRRPPPCVVDVDLRPGANPTLGRCRDPSGMERSGRVALRVRKKRG